jgi:transposase
MAYDTKFRERVLNFIDKGHTAEEAHKVFDVGTTTIKQWKKLRKETGRLEKRPLERGHKKIDPVRLETYIAKHPDSYLREIADVFNCSDVAVLKALRRLQYSRKKN